MTEREKLEKGLWYDANYDAELLEERLQAEDLCFAFNQTRPSPSWPRFTRTTATIAGSGRRPFSTTMPT